MFLKHHFFLFFPSPRHAPGDPQQAPLAALGAATAQGKQVDPLMFFLFFIFHCLAPFGAGNVHTAFFQVSCFCCLFSGSSSGDSQSFAVKWNADPYMKNFVFKTPGHCKITPKAL